MSPRNVPPMTGRAAIAAVGLVLALVSAACSKPVSGEAARGSDAPTTGTSEIETTTSTEAPPTTTEQQTEASSSLETPATTITDDEPATEIVTVSPFDEQSRLRIPIDTDEPPIDGSTCEQSILRPGMLFECGPSAAYLPACWPIYLDGDTELAPAFPLYCMRSPDSSTVIEFRPEGDPIPVVPEPDDVTDASAIPWEVDLVGGIHCGIRIGGAWGDAPDGFVYSYGCDDDTYLLARDTDGQTIDRSDPLWIATAQQHGSPEATEVAVTKVYFAGPTPTVAGPRLGAQCPDPQTLAAAAAPDWTLEPDQVIVCADDWAVATGWPTGDDEEMLARPRLFANQGGGNWSITPESDFCTDKQGSQLILLVWCYAS